DANLQVIQNTQMQIQALNESMARDRDRRLIVERVIADADAAEHADAPVAAAGADLQVGSTLQQLQQAQQALKQAELRLTPDPPDVQRMRRQIELLRDKAAGEATTRAGETADPAVVNPAELARRNRLKELRAELESLDHQFAKKEAEEK